MEGIEENARQVQSEKVDLTNKIKRLVQLQGRDEISLYTSQQQSILMLESVKQEKSELTENCKEIICFFLIVILFIKVIETEKLCDELKEAIETMVE